ncbi:Yersiniabactin/pesticin outer membrane receptor (IRPC) [Klebsiella michiganensis]|uniref:Yersiniabactin/pesticin outer membrane receptor (IRPC) n=1 Tax=Klebsiella michiganensis TaxID=1134687 RepID=A0A7H4MZB0_9ENTR|nr:Yersiniabactin/pesticin outer membrane receptor (IRPC) [Klebsiella michiganensis]
MPPALEPGCAGAYAPPPSGDTRTVDMVFGLYRQNTREKLNSAYDMPTMPYLSSTGYTTAETLAAYSRSDLAFNRTF